MQALQDYIQKLMAETGLSKSALAEKLGYRSKTSLDRIMQDNTREASLRKFKQSVLAAFPLSAEGRRELNEAVQIGIYGLRQYLLNQQMWLFVRGDRPESAPEPSICDALTGEAISLRGKYSDVSDLNITVLNCQYVPSLFSALHALLEREGVSVNHYVFVDHDSVRTMATVNVLMRVFYQTGYDCLVLNALRRAEDATETGMNQADLAIFEYMDADGCSCEDSITFQSSTQGMFRRHAGAPGITRKMLGLGTDEYYSIKLSYFDYDALNDYVKYSADYAALEENRAIWKIKPDIGVDQIPVHIMEAALLRGPMMESGGSEFFEVLSALREVYRKRVTNTFTKKKHAYTIFKRRAFQEFAKTGRTTDHFWAMTPYTVDERIEILETLLDQQRNNSYIHMHFLKDDDDLRDIEIACYEDTGLLLLEADTDYHLEQGHSEVLITHAELLRLFREFFMRVLIREYVLPESETCNFLESLLTTLKVGSAGGAR